LVPVFTLLAFFDLGYLALLIAALGFGAAHALFGLARHSLLSSLVPQEHRPRSMSLLGGMFRGGLAIGPVIGSGFIALFGVQSGYLVAAAMILAAGISVLSVKPEQIITPQSGKEGGIWEVAKREAPKLATLGVASAIISAGRTIRLIGLPLLAIQLGLDLLNRALSLASPDLLTSRSFISLASSWIALASSGPRCQRF
jgi:predicted MFS family arabinose efflux permease